MNKFSIRANTIIDPVNGICKKSIENASVISASSPSFPIEIFPPPIREIISSYLQSEDFNRDFLCSSMFTIFASAMGNQWEAQFTNSMRVSPILYMMLVGPPSSGKKFALRQAEIPIRQYDMELGLDYNRKINEYGRMMQMSPMERQKHGLPKYPDKPAYKEILVTDYTIEKLFRILKNNPRGILVCVDELNKLVNNLNRYGKGYYESCWINFFDGNQVKYERKSSGEYIKIFHPYVSVIGRTRPDLLPKMFSCEREASGFTTLFLKVFPDITKMPKWKFIKQDKDVTHIWTEIICNVLKTPFKIDTNGEIVPRVLEFSQKAKKVLFLWTDKIEQEWENSDSYMRGVCAKLRIYVIRFSLIIHVMRLYCGEIIDELIDEQSTMSACMLADYFLEMDKRIDNLISNQSVNDVH